MTDHDDDLAFDALLARKAEGDSTVQVEIDELLDRRAAEWAGIVVAAGNPPGPPTRVVEGPRVERPPGARVRCDGQDTLVVLRPDLGGTEQEAALEALWRESYRRNRAAERSPGAA